MGYLRLTIKAPQNADNIPLSPAYRLLAIALKRRLLARYHSANDLLQGREVNILIADKFLNHPVFPALSAHGLKLDFTKAASAHSFTDYLKKRAEDAGFENATVYPFVAKPLPTSIEPQVDLQRECFSTTTQHL